MDPSLMCLVCVRPSTCRPPTIPTPPRAGQLVSRSLPRLPADTPMYQLLRLFEAGGSHMVALTRPKAPVSACHQDPAAAAGSSSSPPAAAAVAPVAAAGAAGAAPGALGLARSSSATGGLQGLHRIKSGGARATLVGCAF